MEWITATATAYLLSSNKGRKGLAAREDREDLEGKKVLSTNLIQKNFYVLQNKKQWSTIFLRKS